MRRAALSRGAAVLALLAATLTAWALHPANLAAARAKIALDGSFVLNIRFDVLAYCCDMTPFEVSDGPMNALLDGPVADLRSNLADAGRRFLAHLKIEGDGAPATIDSTSFPTAADVLDEVATGPRPRLPVMMVAVVTGRLPKGARTSQFGFPETLGEVVLTTEFPFEEPVSEPVDPGSLSTPLTLPTAAQVAQVERAIALHSRPAPPATKAQTRPPDEARSPGNPFAYADASAVATAAGPVVQIESTVHKDRGAAMAARDGAQASPPAPARAAIELPAQTLPWYETLPRYVKMGYLHIVPQGLDHILFVLGLFLLSTRTKDLLKQITAFTVAHSLTLALSLYGVVSLPPTVVEPVIALSIVFVAVENLFSAKMHRWRVGVVFLFGLVHGLGFASALRGAGLTRGDFLTALFGFNCGVEIGQLSVVACALVLVGWFRTHRNYRPYFAMPASLAIALVAAFWAVQRLSL